MAMVEKKGSVIGFRNDKIDNGKSENQKYQEALRTSKSFGFRKVFPNANSSWGKIEENFMIYVLNHDLEYVDCYDMLQTTLFIPHPGWEEIAENVAKNDQYNDGWPPLESLNLDNGGVSIHQHSIYVDDLIWRNKFFKFKKDKGYSTTPHHQRIQWTKEMVQKLEELEIFLDGD